MNDIMKHLYKGFIVTKDKRPLMPFKSENNPKLMTWEHIQECNYQEYGGVLNTNVVLIDVDDTKQSEVLLQIVKDNKLHCRVLKTSRGMHFLFNNHQFIDGGMRPFNQPFTKILLACGINADIKVGCKNTIQILKYDGVERQVIYDNVTNIEKGLYDDVPFYLWHFEHDKLTNNVIYPIENGQRNDTIYEYKLALYRYFKQSFNKSQYKQVLQLVNKYICTEPIDDKEFNVIARYENNNEGINKEIGGKIKEQPKKKPEKLNELEIALLILNTKCEHFINFKNKLYVYENNVYTCDDLAINRALNRASDVLGTYIGIHKREYVKIQLLCNLPTITKMHNEYINFKNGLYNVKEHKFLGTHSPLCITFNQIPHNYTNKLSNQAQKNVEQFFDDITCNNEHVKKLLFESIGYSMYTRKSLRKMFILHGGKCNGKSTFLKLVENVIGEFNTCALAMQDLEKRFKPVALNKKLLCLGDDIENTSIELTSTLKKVVSGDEIEVEEKGKQPFRINPYASLFFSCNEIPRIKNDNSGALLSRIIYIPFHNYFKPSVKFKRQFDDTILNNEQAMEYIVNKAVTNLHDLLERESFTSCQEVQELTTLQSVKSSTISTFITDKGYLRNDFIDKPIRDCYNEYCDYINSIFDDEDDLQDIKKESIRMFSKYIRNNYNLKSQSRKIEQQNGLKRDTKVFIAK